MVKLSLPELSPYPEELKNLLFNDSVQAKILEITSDNTTVHLHLHH